MVKLYMHANGHDIFENVDLTRDDKWLCLIGCLVCIGYAGSTISR